MTQANEPGALHWETLTWEEIAELKSQTTLTLLPVGATEQHGPHLGVGMDFYSAGILCDKVSSRTRVPVLPRVHYGCSLGHSKKWPGTLSLQPETLMNMITEIYEWTHASGFNRMLLINGHVTNYAPLRCALEKIRSTYNDAMVGLYNVGEISPRVRKVFYSDADDWHANRAETSYMLAKCPQLVRKNKLSEADDVDRTAGMVFAHSVNRTSSNGTTGTPSKATVEEGEKLFNWMVEDLCALVMKAKDEQYPVA
ncbi:MAG: creatininase family protein [Verrucomicrobiota bacterium]